MIIIKDYRGGDWNHDHKLKIPRLHPNSALTWKGVISASGRRFVMLTRFNMHMVVWVPIGRWWKAIEGKKYHLFVYHFFFKNKSNDS